MPARKSKKRVRKKISKRVVGTVQHVGKTLRSYAGLAPRSIRIGRVVKNLVLFAVLFAVSVVVASISNNEIVDQLFWIVAILTAFVAVALLIVLLIFVFAGSKKGSVI